MRSPTIEHSLNSPGKGAQLFIQRAILTWDVITPSIGSSKLHSIFTRPIGAPITGCAHWHRQRSQHQSDRTHQVSDIPRPSDSFGSIRRNSDPTAQQTCRHITPRGIIGGFRVSRNSIDVY